MNPEPQTRQAADALPRPGPPRLPTQCGDAIDEGKAAASSPTITLSLTRAQAEALLRASRGEFTWDTATTLLGAAGVLRAHLEGRA